MTCVRCLLASREKLPAARRVKDEGAEGNNNHRSWAARWAERHFGPSHRFARDTRRVEYPTSPVPLSGPDVSLLPAFTRVSTARLFRFCLPRESFEPRIARGGKSEAANRRTSKVQARGLPARVRHFASILSASRGHNAGSFLAQFARRRSQTADQQPLRKKLVSIIVSARRALHVIHFMNRSRGSHERRFLSLQPRMIPRFVLN